MPVNVLERSPSALVAVIVKSIMSPWAACTPVVIIQIALSICDLAGTSVATVTLLKSVVLVVLFTAVILTLSVLA